MHIENLTSFVFENMDESRAEIYLHSFRIYFNINFAVVFLSRILLMQNVRAELMYKIMGKECK